MQSKKNSVLEVFLNYLSGFIIAWLLTLTVLPYYGYQATPKEGFQITIIFTIVSIIRTYIWRRLFNYFLKRRHYENNKR